MIWLLACSTPCPEGVADAERLARLEALVGELGEACFAERSVLVGETILLDASQPDPALAAKARHLALHREQGPEPEGPGCLETWLQREEEAWALENHWRAELGLEPVEMDPSLEAEYAARCAQ